MNTILGVVIISLCALLACGEDCRDKSTYCRTWKNKGYCTANYVAYMRGNCKKTCGHCPKATRRPPPTVKKVPAKADCKDKDQHKANCEKSWKQYCTKSSEYWTFMKDNCKKTCGLCSSVVTGCRDSPQQAKGCLGFKSKGHCKKSSSRFSWMHKNCAKTCKFCRDDCGSRGVVLGRVIGGVEAEAHSWPWSVALLRFGSYFCGGALIDEEWVLTAAHCVSGKEEQSNYMEVILGEHNRRVKENTEQKFAIEKIISHADYSSITLDNDIAMIKLKKKVSLKKDSQGNPDKIGLVCLPKQGKAAKMDKLCYITGWGKTKHPGPSSNILMEAQLPVVTNTECKRLNSQWGGTAITKNMICAGQKAGTITSGCHGDSGGPFVCNNSGNKWTLTGAVSWGSSTCTRSERYTVFARVSEYRDWVDNIRHTK